MQGYEEVIILTLANDEVQTTSQILSRARSTGLYEPTPRDRDLLREMFSSEDNMRRIGLRSLIALRIPRLLDDGRDWSGSGSDVIAGDLYDMEGTELSTKGSNDPDYEWRDGYGFIFLRRIAPTSGTYLVSGDRVVGPTDGTETIVNARDLYTGHVDSYFLGKYGLNVPSGKPFGQMSIDVHEVKDTLQMFGAYEMFTGFNVPLSQLCLDQGQINNYVREYREECLADGRITYFLVKAGDKIVRGHRRLDTGEDIATLNVSIVSVGSGVWEGHKPGNGLLDAMVNKFIPEFGAYGTLEAGNRVILPRLRTPIWNLGSDGFFRKEY